MRFDLRIDLESRDGTSAAVGARIVNGYVDKEGQQNIAYKRFALSTTIGTFGTGAGRGLFYDAAGTALYALSGTTLKYFGTSTTAIATFTQTSLAMASFAVTT